VDQFFSYLQSLHPLAICGVVFFVAFLENLFPPAPSDMVIVFGGYLVGLGTVGFPETLLLATAGSTIGFMTMYKVGNWIGAHWIETGKLKFIPVPTVKRVEAWFVRYGFWVIVVNRFLAGTRAAVAFVAGMSGLDFRKTSLLSGVSALLWNAILVTAGYYLGANWSAIAVYMRAYGRIVTIIALGVALLIVIGYLLTRKKGTKAQ
jgi:membrane protein DedA with SNARE-associated domain